MDIKVSIIDNRNARIEATLIGFQTVAYVHQEEDGKIDHKSFIFGICIGPTGHFYLRKPGEMIAKVVGNGIEDSPPSE